MKKEKPRLDIPPLLLEGDEPSVPSAAKAKELPEVDFRFREFSQAATEVQEFETHHSIAQAPPREAAPPGPEAPPPAANEQVSRAPAVSSPEPGDLSESYGTGALFLMPRDPHWLYAYWDVSPEQQRTCNRLSDGNQFLVRVQPEAADAPAKEMAVQPESRHWFFHVEQADTPYSAQLGYYQADGQWQTVACSSPAITPPEKPSQDYAVQFASVDFGVSLPPAPNQLSAASRILDPIQPHNLGWIPALATGTASHEFPAQLGLSGALGQPGLPRLETPELGSSSVASFWTPEKEAALTEQLGVLAERQKRKSSTLLESLAVEGAPGASSPLDVGQPTPQGFWFHVNAELVIFGGTEVDAAVTIGGQSVQLQEDGTFSFRVALPDGQHQLPIVAVSVRGQSRQFQLQFSRFTQRDGDPR